MNRSILRHFEDVNVHIRPEPKSPNTKMMDSFEGERGRSELGYRLTFIHDFSYNVKM